MVIVIDVVLRGEGVEASETSPGKGAFLLKFLDYFLCVCLDVRNAMLIRNMGLELVFGVEEAFKGFNLDQNLSSYSEQKRLGTFSHLIPFPMFLEVTILISNRKIKLIII